MYGVGIDTGGTFTDLVAIDRQTGEVRIGKRPSTPDAPSRATLEVLQRTFPNPRDVHGIVLGTTIAANAQLRSGGASTLYVTTRGFEDVPFIQRVARKEAYNPAWKKPAPGILRRHTFGVVERTLHTGEIELDLAESELARLGEWIERWMQSDQGDGATESRQWSVALNLLFSYANAEHERQIVDYLAARFAALPVSASHNVCPTWREYERATTTIVDARIKPMLRDFTAELRHGLEQAGFTSPLSLMKSNGGHAEASSATERSVDLLLSGLAGGIIGGQHVADHHGSANAVTLDMGGTSCDVGVIVDGAFKATTAYEVEWGVPISAPFIDYTCIGAGGGSIAEIDAGGLLRVGPDSAGADPGPASYGRGGERATVTDANLVLGRLDPEFFLGGSMPLEPERARSSLEPLSDELEISLDDAALAVIETTNQNMAGAIRLLTVERGLDHREFDLVAFGGAGALHAVELASSLGMRRVIVPPNPGLYSALGTLIADFRVDKALTVMHRSDHDQLAELSAQLVGLTAGALDELRRDGYEGSPTVVGQLNMRYQGQNFGELVTVQAGELDEAAFEAAIQSFHQKHEDLYGYALPDTVVEVTEVRALAIGTREPPPAQSIPSGALAEPLMRRAVSFPGHGAVDSAIYRRSDLLAGVRIHGPAVIEDTDSTTVLPPEAELLVASDGSLIIDVVAGAAALAGRVAAGAVDSVTLSVVNNHLRNICDEMVTAMVQTAHSPIFSESRDFSCMLFNRDLELIGQAEMNPAIICAGLHTVPFTVEELGIDSFRPGDVIVHNDPYRGSCHMPEHLLLKPIFVAERLIGFAANIAHIAEIGGMAVGSFASTATEVFQEGLRLPPVKLMDEGDYVRDVWRVIMANHRTPKTTWGDFHAMMASLSTAERRLQRLVAQLGVDRFDEICSELVAYADRWMRGEIARIPNGVYSFVDSMEDDGVTDKPSYIRASLVVDDDDILVDLSESDRQAQGPINCTYVATCAASYAGVLQAIGARDVPLNSGCFRPLTVLAPPGTVVNVSFPGPCVGGNTETQPRIIGTVLGALAQAVPENVGAAEGGTCCNVLLGGWHPRSGDFYTHYQFEGGGWGGRPTHDGNDAQCTAHASIVRATPVEVFETRFPLRHLSFSLRTDSGGPGRHRGGLGICRVLEIVADEVVVSALCDRMKQGPWGLAGGLDGATGGVFVRLSGEGEFRTFTDVFGCTSPSKFVNIVLRRGDQIMVASPGGGGFGLPSERSDDDVIRDVLDRYVSETAAAEHYGHVLGLSELDHALTPSSSDVPSQLPALRS